MPKPRLILAIGLGRQKVTAGLIGSSPATAAHLLVLADPALALDLGIVA